MEVDEFSLEQRLSETMRSDKVVAALFSTYSFDRNFFEDVALRLIEQGRARGTVLATVIVDHTRYADPNARSGRGYDVVLAPPSRVWHAKAITLMVRNGDDKRTVLAVGSGNLTRAGWQKNRELFSVTSWPGWKLPRAIMEWLAEPWLRTRWFGDWAKSNVTHMYSTGEQRLVSSVTTPLWDQVPWLKWRWTEAHVVAPFCDSVEDPDAAKWSEKFFVNFANCAAKGARLNVYLRGIDESTRTVIGDRAVFERVKKQLHGVGVLSIRPIFPKSGRLLHAKLIAAKIGAKWSMLVGSPNATAPALISPGSNVELAWDIEDISKPKGLLPSVPSVNIADLRFEKNQITRQKLWNAIQSARFVPTHQSHGALEVEWIGKHGPHDTVTSLDNHNLDDFTDVDMQGVQSWFLETMPAHDLNKHRPGVVPIEMPAEAVILVEDATKEMSPDDLLNQLAGTVTIEDEAVETTTQTSQNSNPSARRKNSKHFEWRKKVLTLDRQLRSLGQRLAEANTRQEIALIKRNIQDAWKAHDPHDGERTAVENAWRQWVRAGLSQSLSAARFDGRTKLHKPLLALEKRWLKEVPAKLRDFPIVVERSSD
jgi:hypothetical protein